MTDSMAHVSIADAWVGRVLREKYRIIRRIGEGGWGVVYEAEHLLLGRNVAIKFLHHEMAADPRFANRFRREARAVSQIGHPNIIEIFDLDRTDEGLEFMVLELLDGVPLDQLVEREGRLALDRAVSIFTQVASGLSAAHLAGVVHRDLKLENVILCEKPDGTDLAKVLDFGVAKLNPILHVDPQSTSTGLVLGTPHAMPPEQILGDPNLDHRADVFAFGVMIYEALAGAAPFEAETIPALLVKILHEPHTPLATHRPELPVELGLLVDRMLSKQATDRPSSCSEVAAVLGRLTRPSVLSGADDDDELTTVHMSSLILWNGDAMASSPTTASIESRRGSSLESEDTQPALFDRVDSPTVIARPRARGSSRPPPPIEPEASSQPRARKERKVSRAGGRRGAGPKRRATLGLRERWLAGRGARRFASVAALLLAVAVMVALAAFESMRR